MTKTFDKFLLVLVSILIGLVAMSLFGNWAPASMMVFIVPIIVAPVVYFILINIFKLD